MDATKANVGRLFYGNWLIATMDVVNVNGGLYSFL